MAILKLENSRAVNQFINNKTCVKQGEVYLAALTGSIRGLHIAPVLVVQNNIGNKYSPCTIVVVGAECGSGYTWDFDKVTTIDKRRLKSFVVVLERHSFMEIHSNLVRSLIG